MNITDFEAEHSKGQIRPVWVMVREMFTDMRILDVRTLDMNIGRQEDEIDFFGIFG